MIDPFDVPKYSVPEWMSYRWVRKSVMGEADKDNVKIAEAAGWRAVPRSRHFNLPAAKMWDAKSEHAEYGGMILMERPDYMTLTAQADLRRKAFELSGHVIGPRVVDPYEVRQFTPPRPPIWRRLLDALK